MAEQRRREEYLIDQSPMRENSFNIIKMMQDLFNQTPGSKHLVDEILHCIFSLGRLNNIRYTPEEFIGDQDILDELADKYPRPFQMFSERLPERLHERLPKQLPKRSPFSCVMDMVVMLKRQKRDEDGIKESLMDIASKLKPTFPVSSTMCVSQPPNSANKYYGVSMSTTGSNPGIIVVAAACLSNWDDYVAEAVMAYSRKKEEEKEKKKKGKGKGKDDSPVFNGTIKLPKDTKCQAFSLSTGDNMKPCKTCGELFGLQTDDKWGWAYGNCAEAESLSKLLKNEQEVKNLTKRESAMYTPENRRKDRESMRKVLDEVLKRTLGTHEFKTWDREFYTPQS